MIRYQETHTSGHRNNITGKINNTVRCCRQNNDCNSITPNGKTINNDSSEEMTSLSGACNTIMEGSSDENEISSDIETKCRIQNDQAQVEDVCSDSKHEKQISRFLLLQKRNTSLDTGASIRSEGPGHYITDIDYTNKYQQQIQFKEEDRLLGVNDLPVCHWSHGMLLQYLSNVLTQDRAKLVIGRRYTATKETVIYEVEILVTFIAKGDSLFELAAHYIRMKVAPFNNIKCLEFNAKKQCWIKHSGFRDLYMCVDDTGSLTMRPMANFGDMKYCFLLSIYHGLRQTGRHIDGVFLATFESESVYKYITMVSPSKVGLTVRVNAAEGTPLAITKPDLCFFKVRTIDQNKTVLASLVHPDHYLCWDLRKQEVGFQKVKDIRFASALHAIQFELHYS